MTVFFTFLFTSLWLGILTSISPCPLASNIAAVSYISGRLKEKGTAIFSGVAYSIGRAIVYAAIAYVAVKSSESLPALSDFLQSNMNKALGFILIVAGMFLTGLINADIPAISIPEKWQRRFGNGSPAGSFVLGALFAFAMCPVSAAIFFGSLIPIVIKARSAVIIPMTFGIGTGLPVAFFAFAATLGIKRVTRLYKDTAAFEKWAQIITGSVFIIAGIFYVLRYVFGIV